MKQILLVEGKDDQHVIWALCKKFNVLENFKVKPTDGIDNLFKQLPVRLKEADLTSLGIIVDADTNIQSRWATLSNLLKDKIPDFPNEPDTKGIILKHDDLKIGIWLMPNNETNGMLESFIEFLIPADDQLLTIVNNHLNQIEADKLNQYKAIHRDKALIHAWLALQENPGTPMGLSITKKYLTTDVEQCQKLINWLKALFN